MNENTPSLTEIIRERFEEYERLERSFLSGHPNCHSSTLKEKTVPSLESTPFVVQSIPERFKEYNRLNGTTISGTEDLLEEAGKVGREVAESVLKEYPDFPENTGLTLYEINVSPTYDNTPKDIFCNYCDLESLKSNLGQDSIKNVEKIKIWILFRMEMRHAIGAVWNENLLNKLENKSPHVFS